MSIENTTEYQESLHFCMNNTPEILARQMARDMLKMSKLERLIADDAAAITFQSLGQYRSALLKALRG